MEDGLNLYFRKIASPDLFYFVIIMFDAPLTKFWLCIVSIIINDVPSKITTYNLYVINSIYNYVFLTV